MIQLFPTELSAGDKLIHNQARIDMLMLEQSRLAAELAQGDQWDREGYNSPYDWIRFNCKVKGNVAGDYLVVGKQLPALTQSVEAMLMDEIGFAHLATMADTVAAVKTFVESDLLPLAKEHSPGKFYRDCLHYRHTVDAARYNEDQEQLREGRSMRLSTAIDGCLLINGVLDPAGGAAVRAVLEPLARPSGTHDDRTPEQRMADAFEDALCGGHPANVQVTTTLETLKGLAGSAAGEMELSLPISGATVQRLACDCNVTRVLLSQESVTIDVGRTKRIMSGALRKALRVRDGHCQWPDCEKPASFCDGHHLVHWIDGGGTNLDNLVLLCRRHHRLVHEGGWQLIKTDERDIVAIPPVVTFGMPRGPD